MSEDEKPPISRMARVETALSGDDEFSIGDRAPRKEPVEISVNEKPLEPPPEAQSILHRIRKLFWG